MGKILILEDSELTRQTYQKVLGERFSLTLTCTVQDALREASQADFDLMLVDLNLPDGEGFDFVKRLRSVRTDTISPFIFVSGRFDIHDKLSGFALGAEDYIVKPFDERELIARVEIRLRRPSASDRLNASAALHGLKIDPPSLRVYLSEGDQWRDACLTPNEFRLLRSLLSSEGKLVSRQELLSSGWGRDVHVLERTVDRHISALRRKLGDRGSSIESVPGQGYRWILQRSA